MSSMISSSSRVAGDGHNKTPSLITPPVIYGDEIKFYNEMSSKWNMNVATIATDPTA